MVAGEKAWGPIVAVSGTLTRAREEQLWKVVVDGCEADGEGDGGEGGASVEGEVADGCEASG